MQGIGHLIINSPYVEPTQHWEYNHHRMAFELAKGRRSSGYTIASTEKRLINDPGVFVQIPLVNKVRERVKEWRENGYAGISGITKNLLEHWHNIDERPNRLFFCQLEAIETLIWLAEAPDVAKVGIDIPSDGGDLTRICSKMATGTGKTIVMAMLIAWQSLNKINYTNKKGYAKDFLVIAPNLTVRSRLRVLLPAGEENYYDAFNIVPLGLREQLRQAKVVIRNWHALAWDTEEKLKKKRSVDKRGTKSDEAYAREVLGEMANSKNFIVINDEAHHAWRIPAGAKLSRDEKKDAEEATIWIGGLDRLNRARGIQTVYDFSATPFIPSGKNSTSENLFGWIVSDFGLTEAIESGLVKTPRVVIRDDGQLAADYRSKFYHLYNDPEVKPSLNKKGAAESEALPPLVENAYALLGKDWREWAHAWRDSGGTVPPVMISVANQTETAARIKYAFDHENILIPELCNPAKTLHIDSKVLETAEAFGEEETVTETQSADEDAEIEPARKLSKKEQAQRLRQTVDTIGKIGEIGEQIQHVISVGMLTEGWDCLDSETEILTPDGWKGMGQVNINDLVYSLNLETEKLEAVPVLDYGERYLRPDEKMVRLKSQHLDIRVTEGHRFYIKYRNPRNGGALSRNTLALSAAQLAQRKSSYALPLAAEATDNFPGLSLSDEEIRLVAWFMTDGGFSNRNVTISQSKIYHQEIRDLLSQLTLDFSEYLVNPGKDSYPNSKPVHVFRIPKGTHTGTLQRNGWFQYDKYLDKAVANSLHAMTKRQFLVFWEELLKGDGERQGDKSGWLWCNLKEQADAYTQMAIERGLSASYSQRTLQSGKIMYRVGVRNKQWLTSEPSDARAAKIILEDAQPLEIVWCVRNQNSTIVTRRNGKIVILGNCHTVTHIMGLRAFSSQLLCEQVVGRGLRRTSYDLDEKGFFTPEYVNIFGVPFAFMPHESPKDSEAKPSVQKQRIQPLTEKVEFEIRFPNVVRIESKFKPVLKLDLNKVALLTLNAYDTREIAELAPVIDGKHDVTRLSEIDLEQIYSQVRLQSSIFRATLDIFKQIQVDWKGDPNALFNQIVPMVEKFIVSDKLQISPPLFGLEDKRKRVLVRLNAATIVNHLAPFIQQENVESYELIVNTNKPIISTTDMKAWDTSKPFVYTRKSHINFCVCDSRWESTAALHLDRSPHVTAWVKNDHLGFEIPYIFNGGEHKYRPDFLAKLSNDEIIVIEIKGEEDQKDKVKREALREWVRAVNQNGGFGRWHPEPAVSKRPDDIPQILDRSIDVNLQHYRL